MQQKLVQWANDFICLRKTLESMIPITLKNENQSLHQHPCMFLEPTIPRSQQQKLLLLFLSFCNMWPVWMWRFVTEFHFRQSLWGNQRVCHCEYTKRTDKTKQQQEKKQTKLVHLSISNCLHKSTKLMQNPELKPTAWKNLKTQILAQSSSRAGLFLWFGYLSQKLSKAELNNHVFPSRTLKELLSFCLLLQESSLLLSAIFQPTVSFSFSKLHNSSPSLLAPPPP